MRLAQTTNGTSQTNPSVLSLQTYTDYGHPGNFTWQLGVLDLSMLFVDHINSASGNGITFFDKVATSSTYPFKTSNNTLDDGQGDMTITGILTSGIGQTMQFVGSSGGRTGTNIGFFNWTDTYNNHVLQFKGIYETNGLYQWEWYYTPNGGTNWSLVASLNQNGLLSVNSINIGSGTIYWQTSTNPNVLESDNPWIFGNSVQVGNGLSVTGNLAATGNITTTSGGLICNPASGDSSVWLKQNNNAKAFFVWVGNAGDYFSQGNAGDAGLRCDTGRLLFTTNYNLNQMVLDTSGNLTLVGYESALGHRTTQTNGQQSLSITLGTTYQNSTGDNIMVCIVFSVNNGNTGGMACKISPTTSLPSNAFTEQAITTNGAASYGCITFIVPYNWYYAVNATGNGSTIYTAYYIAL